jgi:hypothetical protein
MPTKMLRWVDWYIISDISVVSTVYLGSSSLETVTLLGLLDPKDRSTMFRYMAVTRHNLHDR